MNDGTPYTPPQPRFDLDAEIPKRRHIASETVDVCSYCRRTPEEGTPFLKCARCLLSSYCSKQCQRDDWPEHKSLCTVREAGAKAKEDQKLTGKKIGKPFIFPELVDRWFRSNLDAIEYAVIHALRLFLGLEEVSDLKTHIVVFSLDMKSNSPQASDVYVFSNDEFLQGKDPSLLQARTQAAERGQAWLLFVDADEPMTQVLHILEIDEEKVAQYQSGKRVRHPRWLQVFEAAVNKN
ncbi:hypothetical protein PROFUN_02124 [Planoprotostelium fungivorum]|uniref:MYND-type domain-containing protein n=1 Tax=Planoprotostelium fungivorum TaxID=1890364 RepID=A0A2P6NZ80_9EUKA|nr:hypothetical protein PROFUN_02124 [Planoprotostelium fungivorum]